MTALAEPADTAASAGGQALPLAALCAVSKAFGGVTVLDEVSLELAAGEVLLVSGPSGSGKSTTLRILAGIEPPDSGEVYLLGERLGGLSVRQRLQLLRTVGLGFQDPLLDNGLPVLENLTALARINGRFSEHRPGDLERLGRLVESLGISTKLRQRTAVLSGGEKLRVALGRALVCRPRLLLLDEPTHMVDSDGKAAIYAALRQIVDQEALSVLVVSHDREAKGVADREIAFDAGRAR